MAYSNKLIVSLLVVLFAMTTNAYSNCLTAFTKSGNTITLTANSACEVTVTSPTTGSEYATVYTSYASPI